MNRKPTTKPAAVTVRITVAGQTYEEVIAGPLVAMAPEGGK